MMVSVPVPTEAQIGTCFVINELLLSAFSKLPNDDDDNDNRQKVYPKKTPNGHAPIGKEDEGRAVLQWRSVCTVNCLKSEIRYAWQERSTTHVAMKNHTQNGKDFRWVLCL